MGGLRRTLLVAMAVAIVGAVSMIAVQSVRSQPPSEPDKVKRDVPADQTYTGFKQCASCHLKEFTAWKKTKHFTEAFESLPTKYRKDGECLKCHSTGYGAPTGYKGASTPNLAGTSCEACHGPGSKHDEIAKKFANKKKLTPEEDQLVRGSIYKTLPDNVCVRCHLSPSHKTHPKYDKK